MPVRRPPRPGGQRTPLPHLDHGELLERGVSLVTRVELARHGFALLGPPPQDVLPPETRDLAAEAARQELLGYWSWAARHPLLFWRLPVMVDLGLTAMARGRHAVQHGELMTKSAAVGAVDAPPWLRRQVQARRAGEDVTSPRLPAAWIAWRDVRRTTAWVRQTARNL